jgi:hypothetical protein
VAQKRALGMGSVANYGRDSPGQAICLMRTSASSILRAPASGVGKANFWSGSFAAIRLLVGNETDEVALQELWEARRWLPP